jgi:hypothetical protein
VRAHVTNIDVRAHAHSRTTVRRSAMPKSAVTPMKSISYPLCYQLQCQAHKQLPQHAHLREFDLVHRHVPTGHRALVHNVSPHRNSSRKSTVSSLTSSQPQSSPRLSVHIESEQLRISMQQIRCIISTLIVNAHVSRLVSSGLTSTRTLTSSFICLNSGWFSINVS